MIKIGITLILTILVIPLSAGNEFCGINNTAFNSGERTTFKVFYNVIGIFVDAGTATFAISTERYNNRPVYHVVGEGRSNSRYDWIFKVRDRYESYIDTATLRPYKFIRNVDEGGYKKYENITFNHEAGTAVSTKGVFKVPDCIQDVLSAIFYARNIDFDKYKPGDKIPFKMFMDDEVHDLYVRYIGKEIVKTRYGRFKSIKFKPLLIAGTMFEGGERMTVWVSDDKNHLPLRVESPISVGSVKVDMMGYLNLRYRLSALINIR
jgi:Protein of unknown function (DUF3108)